MLLRTGGFGSSSGGVFARNSLARRRASSLACSETRNRLGIALGFGRGISNSQLVGRALHRLAWCRVLPSRIPLAQ